MGGGRTLTYSSAIVSELRYERPQSLAAINDALALHLLVGALYCDHTDQQFFGEDAK